MPRQVLALEAKGEQCSEGFAKGLSEPEDDGDKPLAMPFEEMELRRKSKGNNSTPPKRGKGFPLPTGRRVPATGGCIAVMNMPEGELL